MPYYIILMPWAPPGMMGNTPHVGYAASTYAEAEELVREWYPQPPGEDDWYEPIRIVKARSRRGALKQLLAHPDDGRIFYEGVKPLGLYWLMP